MSGFARIRSLVNKMLAPAGFAIARRRELISEMDDRWSMLAALRRAATLGIRPRSIIDIGAAAGEWSQLAHCAFPDADYALVEPLGERSAALAALSARYPRMRHVPAAAGAAEGQVTFDVSRDLDGSGVYGGSLDSGARRVPLTTVDSVVQAQGLLPPFVLKLDTHGYELPILAGAAKTLVHTELLVIEVYNFHISPTAVPFWELCTKLAGSGFRPSDICGFMARPGDGLFWQSDIFFLPAGHPSFRNSRYAT
jgi:FkbM family methyltransferase